MSTNDAGKLYWVKIKGFKLTQLVNISYHHTGKYHFQNSSFYLSVDKQESIKANTKNNYFFLYDNGILVNPTSLTMYKDWANEWVANYLPNNYSVGD